MQILFGNLCKQFTGVECFTNSRSGSHLTEKLPSYGELSKDITIFVTMIQGLCISHT